MISKIRRALHTGREDELVSLGAGEVSRVLLMENSKGLFFDFLIASNSAIHVNQKFIIFFVRQVCGEASCGTVQLTRAFEKILG